MAACARHRASEREKEGTQEDIRNITAAAGHASMTNVGCGKTNACNNSGEEELRTKWMKSFGSRRGGRDRGEIVERSWRDRGEARGCAAKGSPSTRGDGIARSIAENAVSGREEGVMERAAVTEVRGMRGDGVANNVQ
eukprot:3875567-Pleurochrysis_carterae.AAC.1